MNISPIKTNRPASSNANQSTDRRTPVGIIRSSTVAYYERFLTKRWQEAFLIYREDGMIILRIKATSEVIFNCPLTDIVSFRYLVKRTVIKLSNGQRYTIMMDLDTVAMNRAKENRVRNNVVGAEMVHDASSSNDILLDHFIAKPVRTGASIFYLFQLGKGLNTHDNVGIDNVWWSKALGYAGVKTTVFFSWKMAAFWLFAAILVFVIVVTIARHYHMISW